MGVVTYTSLDDYAPRGAATVNAILNAFVTQSTNIQGVNLRDEGLDGRVLAAGVATDGYEYVESTTRYYARNFAAFTPLVLDASIELTNGGAGWSVGQNIGSVRCRFSTEWAAIFPAYVYPNSVLSNLLQFRIAYRIDGAAYAAVPNSVRPFRATNRVAVSGISYYYVTSYKDNFKYAFLIPYPLDGAAHTINSIRIEVHTAGVACDIGATTFTAMRFVKAVT